MFWNYFLLFKNIKIFDFKSLKKRISWHIGQKSKEKSDSNISSISGFSEVINVIHKCKLRSL